MSLLEIVLFSGIVLLLGTLSQPNTGNYTPGHVSRYNPLATPLPERSGRGFWPLSTRRAASRMPAIHAAFRMPRTLYLPLCTPKPLAASRDANTIRVQTDRNRCRSCNPTAANRPQPKRRCKPAAAATIHPCLQPQPVRPAISRRSR